MRQLKNGDPAIPRVTWMYLGNAHEQFAESLSAILNAHAIAEPAMAALRTLVAEHLDLADRCDAATAATKRGRPRKSEPVAKQNAKRGRPVSEERRRYDHSTYLYIEERRAELVRTNKTKPTIRAAIESFDMEMAGHFQRRPIAYAKARQHSTRASYMRGRRLAGL